MRFTPNDTIEISYELRDEDLVTQLIAHNKPRFREKHVDELDSRWSAVLFKCPAEAFIQEHRRHSARYLIHWGRLVGDCRSSCYFLIKRQKRINVR